MNTEAKQKRKRIFMSREVNVQPDEAAVRMRAFELWSRAGMPAGSDLDFWLKAQKELEDDIKATGGRCGTTVDGGRKQKRFVGQGTS